MSLDRACFEEALAACIEEQPILRTGFRLDGARPLQHVHAAIDLPLSVEDLRTQAPEEQDAQIAAWMEARKRHVFDWHRGPLFSVHVFRRTDDSFHFILSFHHAVLDGWSRAAFSTALYQRYDQGLRGETLPPVHVDWTYRDFIAHEQQFLRDPAAKAHFRRILEDAPAVQLPRTARGTSAHEAHGRTHESVTVTNVGALSQRVLTLASELGVPGQVVPPAAHCKVLSMVSGQTRVLSCVTQHGRPETAAAERSRACS